MRRSTSLLVACACFAGSLAIGEAAARAQESPPPGHWVYVPQQQVLDWNVGDPIPADYRPEKRSRKGLVVWGAVLFGSVYGTGIIGVGGNAFGGGPGRESWLLLPGIGPLVLMAQTTNPAGDVGLAVDALAQLSGVAMFVYGVAAPKDVLVYHVGSGVSLSLAPVLGTGRSGLGLVGQF